jgi:putative drug exporter of the RND superfamily
MAERCTPYTTHPRGTIMDRFTRGIALASARHPWRTITSWVVALGAVLFLAASGGGTFADDFAAPGSQSARAMELLDESFPEAAQGKALIVFAAEDGETLDDHRADIARVLSDVATVDHVESVADPFAAGTVSEDGRIGFAELTLDASERELGKRPSRCSRRPSPGRNCPAFGSSWAATRCS